MEDELDKRARTALKTDWWAYNVHWGACPPSSAIFKTLFYIMLG